MSNRHLWKGPVTITEEQITHPLTGARETHYVAHGPGHPWLLARRTKEAARADGAAYWLDSQCDDYCHEIARGHAPPDQHHTPAYRLAYALALDTFEQHADRAAERLGTDEATVRDWCTRQRAALQEEVPRGS